MPWRYLCCVLCLVAAPLGAQIWKSDVPPLTHGWIGVDAGGAIEGAVARTKATGAFRAEVGSLVSPHTVLMVDGLLLLPASSNADCGVDAHGQSTCGVSNDWHLDGLSGSIGRTWGLTGETPRIIASVGAGGYGSQSLTHVHAGVDAAITWAVADWSHLAAVVSVQGILLPNVDGKRIWAIPITVGLRRH